MSCKNKRFWDNGYLYGCYCDISGNECDHSGYREFCAAFEEDNDEE